MSDDHIEEEEGEETEAQQPKRRIAGRTLVLYIVLPAILLISGGALGVHYLLPAKGIAESEKAAEIRPAFFYELPEMLVNLSQRDKRSQFLKVKIALEMTDREVPSALQPMLPRVLDTFQIYLRELRPDDLEGSAGIYRLKEELLRRVNLAIRPHKVDRILFKEIIVQ